MLWPAELAMNVSPPPVLLSVISVVPDEQFGSVPTVQLPG
jgi:hypothetical protein